VWSGKIYYVSQTCLFIKADTLIEGSALKEGTMRIKFVLLAVLFLAFTSFVFASNSFTANHVERLVSNTGQPAQSSFEGQYSGEWIAKYTDGSNAESEGTWKISIASNGQIKGTETDKNAGISGPISGFINDEGYAKVFVKYESGRVAIQGVLQESGGLLTGTLDQTCNSSSEICANIDVILKRN
jgi:hypothetical protein